MPINRRPVSDLLIYVPSVASTAYTQGDLLYLNSGVATLASAQADQSSEAANQALFADNFLGVCHGKKLASNSGTDEIAVSCDGEFEFPCDSTTWAVGEFAAAQEQSNGTQLENQKVKKTSTRADAIGVCVKAGTSITKVRIVLWSRFNKPLTQGT
jgi:hypothetical protein